MMRKTARALQIAILATSVTVMSSGLAQNSQDVREYVQKARAAYREKNYPVLIENLKLALALRPNHGAYTYNIAVGYALSGNRDEAFNWLNRLADMGLVFPASQDKDFDSIRDTEEFKAILEKFARNAKPVGRSVNAFTIREKGLVPEGLAYDPVEKIFYVGSVYKRKVLSIDGSGQAKDFSTAADGLWSVMGLRVDPHLRILWVCTASQPQMMNFSESERGLSGIFKYDLKTKKLLKKYLLPQSKPHWLGDLVLNSRGDVFASDSITPAIYTLNKQKDELELFLEHESFANPQGLTFDSSAKLLFMADYLKGVFVIDLKTKDTKLLKPPTATTMLGIDGLYYYKGKLIAVQNGVRPNRLVEFSLDDNASEVQKLVVLEANNPLFDEPTLAVLSGETLFYIANSQWAMVDEKGKLKDQQLQDAIILKLRL